MIKEIAIVFGLTFILLPFCEASDPCSEWFKESKIQPSSKRCLVSCASLVTDMETFHCPNECHYFCKSKSVERMLFKHVYYPGLTKAERALVARYPGKALEVFKKKNVAERRTQLYFPKSFKNDEGDAFRHFVWAGLLRKELGEEFAQMFLDAHENTPHQAESERGMDLANNRAGLLEAGRRIKNKNFSLKILEESALKHLREQKLVVLKRGLEIPKEVKE